jgi:Fe(3+) dicitrate transport protein
MRSLIFVLFVFWGFSSSASEIDNFLGGRVISHGAGVPYVAVYVKGTAQGTTTNENGEFNLPLGSDNKVIIGVQGLGYKTTYIEITRDEISGDLNISLEPDTLLLEQVTISGSRVGILRFLPGSVTIIDAKHLKSTQPVSGNDILRSIPGLHVVEEEGAGLRTNIGIRGLDPDKSRNVLMLEDGIPVALAPYGEPEMYFTPNIDRMSGLEVLKGNGSILFGPQTIGGVINYLTPDAPKEAAFRLSVKGGDFGFFSSYVDFGNTINNTGFLVNYTRKQADNFGPTQFLLHDFNAKIQTDFTPISQLVVKMGVYDEQSNSTYVGITQPMYDAGGFDALRIAPNDQLDVRRYSLSVNHKYLLGEGLQLNTTVFGYTTTRNWNRQDFSNSSSATNQTGVIHGLEDGRGGAIYLRNTTGQRNRQFEVAGIEPRIQYRYAIGSVTSKLDAGVRYLYERAFEQRVNGTFAGALSGNLQEDEIRTGNALSGYVQNKFMLNDKFSLLAGLRQESIWYDREILRLSNTDTHVEAKTDVSALIPGAGINYNLSKNLGIFAGIHRGFAPPRTKDAISNDGENLELDAEMSWNTELGVRGNAGILTYELTGFHMNFSNQVIPVSESSGGAGAGLVNGGETKHAGIEGSLKFSFDAVMPEGWNGGLIINGTYVDSEFSGDRFVLQKTALTHGFENEYVNIRGNKTPYAPEFTLSGGIQAETPFGLGASLTGNYVGSQFTDVLNTGNVYYWIARDEADLDYRYTQANTNGRIGKMDAYFVTNLNVWYKHARSGLGANMGIKNLTDERYIASRRPQGIRVGLPRFVSAGVTLEF